MDYRFVVLNSTGQASHAEDWTCASDVEAIERASESVPSYGAQLWREGRRLRTFAGPLDLHDHGEPASRH